MAVNSSNTGKKKNVKTKKSPKTKVSRVNMNKLIFVSLLLIILAGYAMYSVVKLLSNPTDIFMVENGKVSLEESAIGYIIRDEVVVQGQNYKNGMEKIKSEGQRTSKNEAIFRYYSNAEDNVIKKIQELSEKIQDVQSQETNIFSSDIKVLDKEIDIKIDAIHNINNIDKIKEYKKDINTSITKKAKIAGDLSPSGSQLRKLIEERSSYEKQLNLGREYIKSPKSGIVSYRVDDLESVLTPDKFSELNKNFLEGLNLKTGQIVASNEERAKVIDNFKSYIATIIDKSKVYDIKEGDSINLRLANQEEIPAKLEFLAYQENNNVLLVFKIEKSVEELINYRKSSFDIIYWSYSGLKVPNSAIIEEDGLSYVVRNRAGYLDKVLVKIKRKNETYSIIGDYDTTELKDLGLTSTQIRSKKNITLYDEILSSPDANQIL